MDGWLDEWMGGWMNGQMDGCVLGARNLETEKMKEEVNVGRYEDLQFSWANDNWQLTTRDINLQLMLISERR